MQSYSLSNMLRFFWDIGIINLLGDLLLHCKWLNTLDSLVFIWSVYPIKIEVESDENIFSMPDFFEKGNSQHSAELL